MGIANISVSGFTDLDRRLAQLERGPTQQEKARALMKGGVILARAERRLAPHRSGKLAGSIVVTMEAEGMPNDGNSVYVGPSLPNGWYGGLVEFGTAHSAPEPFVRPAVAQSGYDAAAAVVTDLAASLKRLAS